MARYTKKYILTDEITYLPMSDDFKIRASRMGFKTIREIVKTRQVDLESMADYTFNWMMELSELAEEYDFLWELESDKRLS